MNDEAGWPAKPSFVVFILISITDHLNRERFTTTC
jgi:hypothetical protein